MVITDFENISLTASTIADTDYSFAQDGTSLNWLELLTANRQMRKKNFLIRDIIRILFTHLGENKKQKHPYF